MAALANGRSVLDAYSYTGGFGIAAANAGAKEVACLDSSAPALALAEDAAAANGAKCKFVKADVFEELERLALRKETFDIVIADPPPFVKCEKGSGTRRQGLSQAGASGRSRHRAGRVPAARLLLAQYSDGALRGGMRRRNRAQRTAARR